MYKILFLLALIFSFIYILNVCLRHDESSDIMVSGASVDGNTSMNHEKESRQKRQLPLMFPEGGTSKFLIGWAIPVDNPMMINLIFAINFQYQYAVPPNISFFTQYYPFVDTNTTRRKRSPDSDERNIFFSAVEKTMDGLGVNGHSCLMRTICEAAESPVHHDGLFGEILQLLFTPSYVDQETKDVTGGDSYTSARRAGEQMYDCRQLYPSCPMGHGLFDIISYLT